MGRLLKRIQPAKEKRKKVSFMISEKILEKLENLQEKLGYQNKSKFVEILLEFVLEELERELNRAKREEEIEEKKEEKLEKGIGPKREEFSSSDF